MLHVYSTAHTIYIIYPHMIMTLRRHLIWVHVVRLPTLIGSTFGDPTVSLIYMYTHTHTHTHTQILVRVHEQFELFVAKDLSNVDHQLLMGVLKTLAKIGPRADPVFRDECEY